MIMKSLTMFIVGGDGDSDGDGLLGFLGHLIYIIYLGHLIMFSRSPNFT